MILLDAGVSAPRVRDGRSADPTAPVAATRAVVRRNSRRGKRRDADFDFISLVLCFINTIMFVAPHLAWGYESSAQQTNDHSNGITAGIMSRCLSVGGRRRFLLRGLFRGGRCVIRTGLGERNRVRRRRDAG